MRPLGRFGCVLKRESAFHSLWSNPAADWTEAVPRRKEIAERLAMKILRDLGVGGQGQACSTRVIGSNVLLVLVHAVMSHLTQVCNSAGKPFVSSFHLLFPLRAYDVRTAFSREITSDDEDP